MVGLLTHRWFILVLLTSHFCWAETPEEKCGPEIPFSLLRAIELTIRYQPTIPLAILDVVKQEGVVQQNAGPFDPLLEGEADDTRIKDAQYIGIFTHLPGEIASATLQGSKTFRVGTQVTIRADIIKVDDPPQPTPLFLYNQGSLLFRIEQPLLRNFYYGSDRMVEESSRWILQAVFYETLDSISQQLLNTINAYWDLIVAQEVLKIRNESVKSYEDLVAQVSRLTEEDQIPKSLLNLPIAQLADEKVNQIQAQQNLYAAIQELKLAVGDLDVTSPSAYTILGTDFFPKDLPDPKSTCEMMNSVVKYALNFRPAIVGSLLREKGAAALVIGAKNGILPELNFFAEYKIIDNEVGQKSRSFLSGIDFQHPEKDYTVGVELSVPFYNDNALGIYKQAKAAELQSRLSTQHLKQQVITSVMNLWTALLRYVNQIKEANDSVIHYEKLVTTEKKRLLEGLSNVFDVVEYQLRLTNALIVRAAVLQSYAQTLATLRYQAGMLLTPDTSLDLIKVEDITKPINLKKECK